MMDAGLKTHDSAFGEMGLDFEEETEKIARELAHLQNLAEKYGIPMSLISKRLESAHEMIAAYQQQQQQQDVPAEDNN
jgi:isopentenyl diphosphate isomerase/L-lactate dehydrogenase-like FMN-dependent dehydrogenase